MASEYESGVVQRLRAGFCPPRPDEATKGHIYQKAVAGSASGFAGAQAAVATKRRSLRLVFALPAAAVILAVAITATMLFTGGPAGVNGITPAFAAEAVKKAAGSTSAAAESGVIDMKLLVDQKAQVSATLRWNGTDVSLVNHNTVDAEVRYVDGRYYETYGYSVPLSPDDAEHQGQWLHYTDYDHGTTPTAVLTRQPAPGAWLEAARTDLAGDGLVAIVTGATGYTRSENKDGSLTYMGRTTLAVIQSRYFGAKTLPLPGLPPLKVNDPTTPVDIRVTVGGNGLIQVLAFDWTLDAPGEASHWSYTSTYSDLGGAAAITAPEAGRTITTDRRQDK